MGDSSYGGNSSTVASQLDAGVVSFANIYTHDVFSGGTAGADTLTGGDGNDVYYVDNVGYAVNETNAVTGGVDSVYSYLAAYTLGVSMSKICTSSPQARPTAAATR